MKARNMIALGMAGSMVAAAALAEAPIMEEIVVTAPYPKHLLAESVATTGELGESLSAAALAEELTRGIAHAGGLTDKIDIKPEIRLHL
ncbi:MAG: hypothetical protein LOD94_09915 [Gammaproteobacteria bacterium]|nr:hypothetical protein [Gammaproteobacteria bacterium]